MSAGLLSGVTEPPPPNSRTTTDDVAVAADAERYSWSDVISSPRMATSEGRELDALARLCPRRDQALERVAQRLARRHARALSAPETPEIVFALRSEGSPYVWPRAWALEGGRPDDSETITRLARFLGSFDDGGERRCGIAHAELGDRRAVAAVALDALADLEAMPTRARAGAWIDVQARPIVEATHAQIVVLGPNRTPQELLLSTTGGKIRGRFAVDRAGTWLVQVLLSTERGPRPVLESVVYVDEEPPQIFLGRPAPGEEHAARELPPADSMERMVQAVRRQAGLRALRRDARLDAIALSHANSMREKAQLAHDVGAGDPRRRIEEAGLEVLSVGENMAHTSSIERAHRALWASPSHRGNLLHSRFDAIGIGVVASPDERVWVCQEFADFR